MRSTIIFATFLTIFTFAEISNAQSAGTFRLTFNGQTTAPGASQTSISFTGLENPDMQIFEAVFPVTSEAECFAKTDFSRAQVLGPDRATAVYDTATGSYRVNWLIPKETRGSCRVLIGGTTADSADYVVWRKHSGIQANLSDDESGRSSLRSVSDVPAYQIVIDPRN